MLLLEAGELKRWLVVRKAEVGRPVSRRLVPSRERWVDGTRESCGVHPAARTAQGRARMCTVQVRWLQAQEDPVERPGTRSKLGADESPSASIPHSRHGLPLRSSLSQAVPLLPYAETTPSSPTRPTSLTTCLLESTRATRRHRTCSSPF